MSEILNSEIRKGFLKIIILRIIMESPAHGYDIIHGIERKSNGHWKPSPGSVYPALEYLESKGYITGKEEDRKKVYHITPKGMRALEQMKEKKMQLLQEIKTFLGDILEENYD